MYFDASGASSAIIEIKNIYIIYVLYRAVEGFGAKQNKKIQIFTIKIINEFLY